MNTNSDFQSDLRDWMNEQHVPGVSLALIEAGKINTVECFGVASSDSPQPVTTDTIFQAASLTKPVFAYLVLKLAASGVIDLDTPLPDYLTEPDLRDEPKAGGITARRVLCHTAGLPNWRMDAPLKIHLRPGKRWSYSGEGYVYLQQVIEHLTGQPLQTLLEAHVFTPLKMTSSSVVWRSDYAGRYAQGHDEQGNFIDSPPRTAANAAYSLYSNPADLACFVLAMLTESDITRQMLKPQIQVINRAPWGNGWDSDDVQPVEEVGWGLQEVREWGFWHEPPSEFAASHMGMQQWGFWHWGDNGTYHCYVSGNPHTGDAAIVMTNSAKGYRIYHALMERLIAQPQPALNWLKRIYGM